jgi:hypothetical protein
MQIYQAMKDLSLDIAACIEKGPHMTGPRRVEKVGHTLPLRILNWEEKPRFCLVTKRHTLGSGSVATTAP